MWVWTLFVFWLRCISLSEMDDPGWYFFGRLGIDSVCGAGF